MYKQQHSYLFKKDKHKGTQKKGGYFLKIKLGFGPVAPTCCQLGLCLWWRTLDTLSSPGEGRSGMGMEACTRCLLLIMRLESASDLPLHLEILCLNTNASQPHCRSLQRLMPHTSLPLDCTQRQKWIDFDFAQKLSE